MVNPIVTYISGAPFTVSVGGALAANGSGQTADLVGLYHLTKGRPPRSGPGYFNLNLSVLCDFKIMEKATVGLRADAFSLTNPPHFANPRTGCPSRATVAGPAGRGELCTTGSNNNSA
ncbi:MAG: hypothetical protein NVS9B15_09970 [Acidobacteriaceae bacterium]